MWRILHSWTGLLLSLVVVVMALTGTVLATKPIYENYVSKTHYDHLTVSEVVHHVAVRNRRITPIEISIFPNGKARIQFQRPSGSVVNRYIDLNTGRFQNNPSANPVYDWIQELHSYWLLGTRGQYIGLVASFAMLIFVVSGIFLLVRRVGGVRQFFAPLSWRGMANLHAALSRWLLIPIAIIAFTACWMAMVSVGWVPTGDSQPAKTVGSVARGEKNTTPWTLPGLNMSMGSVTQIVYPIADDPTDSWTVYTKSAAYSIDQYTGKVLLKSPLPVMKRVYNYVLFLHTAEGSTVWAIILLLASLTVPIFAFTGLWSWTQKQIRKGGRIRHNSLARQADMVLLVGTESLSTWGFARALHQQLHAAGLSVKTQEMNQLARHYPKAKAIVVLSSTYGDGTAPQSASRFLRRLKRFTPQAGQRFAVLGFGDKSFSTYCAFAQEVSAAMQARWMECQEATGSQTATDSGALLPFSDIDKQSAQRFSAWCRELGQALGVPLEVDYTPKRPRTHAFTLVEKKTFGEGTERCISILRFEGKRGVPGHVPGDLISIYPPDCAVPRLYSLGSARSMGFIEFCVRKQAGGLCSPWLSELQVGQTIDANLVTNERFHAPKHRKPLILIGAGTGIGPLVGFIRANHRHRPMYLFWGGRDPAVDALYAEQIEVWLQEKKLSAFMPAWSRVGLKNYVQDVLAEQHELLKTLMQQGACVMICGGSSMAEGVGTVFNAVANDLKTSVAQWQRNKRYMQDVY